MRMNPLYARSPQAFLKQILLLMLLVLGALAAPLAAAVEEIAFETGVQKAVGSDSWSKVQLARKYNSMVVVATPHLKKGMPPLVARVVPSGAGSFKVRLFRADGGQGVVSDVKVHYLVVEEGVYKKKTHGIKMEAVRFESTVTDRSGSWKGQKRNYKNSYRKPVVLGQVLSNNRGGFVTFWSRGPKRTKAPVANDLRVGKHVGEDPESEESQETIGYIVVETGAWTVNGQPVYAKTGSDIVRGVANAAPYEYSVAGAADLVGAVLSQAAMDAKDGSWAMLYGTGPVKGNSIRLAVDEDQLGDGERKHSTEQVAFVAFGAPAADDTLPVDSDGDGVADSEDAFPNDPTETQDTDGDGVGDNSDAFPSDPSETKDSDQDGIGDNADPFPNDPDTQDADGDGVPDSADAFPNDPTETMDTDGDGVGDNSDAFPLDYRETKDSDEDGVGDNSDAFPEDPSETKDSDQDGVGDNADAFPKDASETKDSDKDGVGDNADAFPKDASETKDSDKDGVGDNADAFPKDPSETKDSDKDGVGDNADAFPKDPSETKDSDKDGVGDNADAFPKDPSETKDSDKDGVGDNADAFPKDPSETKDSDKDGVGDNADAFPKDPSETKDSDKDGVGDNADAFPKDPSETKDSDKDGVGDNADAFPNDPAETKDSDGDGIGDNSDPYPNDPTNGGGGGGDPNNDPLVITSTAPTNYQWGTLSTGASVYVDRSFIYKSLPDAYQGLDVLQTANDDKSATGDAVSFSINRSATVYVAHDVRIQPKPSWLGSWSDTGDELDTGDTRLRVYAKDHTAGQVILGANGGPAKSSMYAVMVGTQGGGGSGGGTNKGSVTLSWTPPTTNVDGTALDDLAGYRIKYGTQQGVYSSEVRVTDPSANSFEIDNLDPGTYFFTIVAFDYYGNESPDSNVATKTVDP